MYFKTRSYLLTTSVLTALGVLNTAHAQVDRVVVTAQKKEQLLEDVPISILAIGEEDIKKKRIEGLDDLLLEIPSLSINTVFRNQSLPGLRGVASLNDNPGVDQSTAIFIDGIFVGQPGHIGLDLFDLERIEVLRGPQGTLQGRNVVGGAINVVTRTPGDETAVSGAVTVGAFGRVDVEGLLAGPIVDGVLAGQVAFVTRRSDGYVKNETTGNMLEADDLTSVRAKLAWTPSDSVEAVVSATYSIDQGYGAEANLTGESSSGISGDPVGGQGPFELDDTVYQDVDGFLDNEYFNITGIVDIDTSFGVITSVTGYYDSDTFTQQEADGTSLFTLNLGGLTNDRGQSDVLSQFSQELRLTGAFDAGALSGIEYTAGVYYLKSDHARGEQVTINLSPGTFLVDGAGFPPGLSSDLVETENDTRSIAVFGDVTIPLTDRLSVIGGVRWTEDEKTYLVTCSEPNGGPLNACVEPITFPADGPVTRSWDALTWRAIGQYDIDDDNMIYASVSRGFKSGGFSADLGENAPGTTIEDVELLPEFALNYEIGAKLSFADRRLIIRPTVFFTELSNIQTILFTVNETGLNNRAVNAGEAEILGAELDILASPANGLDLNVNYAYLDTEYTQITVDLADPELDFTGNRMIQAPKHAISAGATYTYEMPNGGALRVHGDVLWKSESFFQPDNNPLSIIRINPTINASLRYAFPDSHWSLALFGKNLTDERTSQGGVDRSIFNLSTDDFLAGGAVSNPVRGTPPRVWGVTLAFDM